MLYVPIRNDENEVVGVSFAGESAESVKYSHEIYDAGECDYLPVYHNYCGIYL